MSGRIPLFWLQTTDQNDWKMFFCFVLTHIDKKGKQFIPFSKLIALFYRKYFSSFVVLKEFSNDDNNKNAIRNTNNNLKYRVIIGKEQQTLNNINNETHLLRFNDRLRPKCEINSKRSANVNASQIFYKKRRNGRKFGSWKLN